MRVKIQYLPPKSIVGWKHNIAEDINNQVKDVNILQNQLQSNYRTLHHLFDELPRVASSHLLFIRNIMCTNRSTAVIIMYCMTVAPLMQIGVTSPVSVCGFPSIPFSVLTDIHTKLHKQLGDMWCKQTVISSKVSAFYSMLIYGVFLDQLQPFNMLQEL